MHIDNIQIKDIHELRMLYVAKYVESLSNITSFRINGTAYKFSKVTEDDIFQAFIDDNAHYDHLQQNYSNYYNRATGTQITQKFEDIEKLVDPGNTYQERLELIESCNNNDVDRYKMKIAELETRKRVQALQNPAHYRPWWVQNGYRK